MDEIELGPLERSWGTAIKASPVDSCLTAAEWIEFVERAEAADCYSRGVHHLAQCLECRTTVQEMRAAELAMITAEATGRVRLPLFGLFKPMTLIGAAATLAVGSAVVLVAWNSHRVTPPAAGRSIVASGTSPISHTHSTETGIQPTHTVIRPGLSAGPRLATPGSNPVGIHGHGTTVPAAIPAGAPNDIDDPTAPATDQQYCLIGSDGVFTMPSPDYKLKERQKIEESYADRVDMARKHYDSETDDPDGATADLNQNLESAAEDRDQQLGTIYKRRDDALDKSLNLKLEAAGPYQVVEVDYQVERTVRQPVRVVVHQPWPGYSPSRRPYGWEYETPYEPREFKSRYVDWRRSYVAAGKPAFCGLVGHAGAVRVDTIFGSRYEGYATSREIGRHRATFGTGSQNSDGYTHSQMADSNPGQGAAPRSTWSGYTHSPSQGGRTSPPSGYTHSLNGDAPSTGFGHSPSSSPGGYSHSQSPQAGAHSIGGYSHSTPKQAGGYSRSVHGRQPQGASGGRGYSGSGNRDAKQG